MAQPIAYPDFTIRRNVELEARLIDDLLDLTRVSSGKLQLSVRSRREVPGRFLVEVRDTGVGIDPGVLPRIFDAFEQGEASVTRRYGGLGLAISRTIVEMHGGTISVSSDGRELGTTFSVHLPVGPRRVPAAEHAAATRVTREPARS